MTDAAPEPDARAGFGRRVGGLAIDWGGSLLVSAAFFPDPSATAHTLVSGRPFATLAIWAIQHLILVATIGTTIGHRIFGLRVVREDGVRPIGFAKAAIRTLMIALVIPAVVWDDEGRGLHDRAAGTRLARARPSR